jgi:hypothetical protein
MGIFIRPRLWYSKPSYPVQINWGHPLADGLSLLVPFNEGAGWVKDLVRERVLFQSGVNWKTSPAGLVYNTSAGLDCGLSDLILTTACGTALCIRRCPTATPPGSTCSLFGQVTGNPPDTTRFGGWVPRVGTTGQFAFGPFSNALGFTYTQTTDVDRLAFVAGRSGMHVWQNNILLAGSSTPITPRTLSGLNLTLNGGEGDSPAPNEFVFFALYKKDMPVGLVQWWMAEPYAMLVPERKRKYFMPSNAKFNFSITMERLQ